ncbi:lipopolysaccharide cholinephosphotransferase [Ruminococcaceae bacterium YRB3002]|nr:lipopolysaccharide cholinephosphotransferase [Ruminococcaceae bacterium YRB3002]
MRDIAIDEAKILQLEILKKVAAFCDGNGIRYFIYYGTYLGALRHGGFIPWDDDIDICMPRPDYERFLQTFEAEDCALMTWTEDNECLCPFSKVYDPRTELHENGGFGIQLGVNIDVFPMDGLPSGDRKIRNRIRFMRFYYVMQVAATLDDPSQRALSSRIVITLIKAFYKLFPIEHYITGRAIKHASRYDFDSSEKVGILVWGYGPREVVRRDDIIPLRRVRFEDTEFWAPGTDGSLVAAYGDYMQLPPEDKQCYKHLPKMNWK